MTKRYCGPDVPELGDLARAAGGWKALAATIGTSAGSLYHMARGSRRMTPQVRRIAEAHGARPAGWREAVAAIVTWAESPAPRRRWRRRGGPSG